MDKIARVLGIYEAVAPEFVAGRVELDDMHILERFADALPFTVPSEDDIAGTSDGGFAEAKAAIGEELKFTVPDVTPSGSQAVDKNCFSAGLINEGEGLRIMNVKIVEVSACTGRQ